MANIADLEAKLPGCVVAQDSLEGRQELGLAELELLRPDGAIDLDFEYSAAQSQGSTMRRDLFPDDFFPSCTNLMRLRDALEAKITEDLTDQVAHRSRRALAAAGSPIHPSEPPESR
jgi:hypothetical protein